MKTSKEIFIEQIDRGYEMAERCCSTSSDKKTAEMLWQNFNGQSCGAALAGSALFNELEYPKLADEICKHYNEVVAPKFEKLYRKLIGLEEA